MSTGSQQTIRQANESVFKARVSCERSGLTRRRIRCQQSLSFEREYTDFIPRIHTNQLVRTELEELCGCLAREAKDNRHTPLPKDIDLPASVRGITGADGKKGLDRIICDYTNL